MTLKKSKENKGQSIFEYFILTTAVVAVVLFFASNGHFQRIRASCENAFNGAVVEMFKDTGSSGGGSTSWQGR